MRVLLIKTSSIGDVVHALSAVQDAAQRCAGLHFDWVCEEGFTDIPKLAPCVDQVIAVAIRRWRKSLLLSATRAEIQQFKQSLQAREYDAVIDAQGLLKTAWITRLARCKNANRWGYDWASAREPLASLAVKHKVNAPAGLHAIERLRVLLGAALGFTPQGDIPILQIAAAPEGDVAIHREILFLHATSRAEKSWPIESWAALGRALANEGCQILLPWGSPQERQQAEKIAQGIGGQSTQVLPKLTIAEIAEKLQQSAGAIGVDTGLMHLSVALGRPTVAVMTASYLPKFSAGRFAPDWAPHARVVRREGRGQAPILPADVLRAWKELS